MTIEHENRGPAFRVSGVPGKRYHAGNVGRPATFPLRRYQPSQGAVETT